MEGEGGGVGRERVQNDVTRILVGESTESVVYSC